MAVEILLPRLGWDMTEGIFGEWLKQDGDAIKPGDLLYTVEGDKATQEVESMDAGILRIRPDGPKMGDTIPVGALLAYIAHPDETVTFQSEPALATVTQATAPLATRHSPPATRKSEIVNRKSISPRARRIAAELGVDWSGLNGSGRTGRIVERDIRAAAELQREPAPSIRATPVAARMAQEAGIDLAALAAQKPGERIGREDVEAAIAAQHAATTPQPATDAEHIPITRVRRLIAQRMRDSAHTTAPVTLTTEADAVELVALRSQLKAAFEPRGLPAPTYNDLFIKLTAAALTEHPLLRAVWQEDEIVVASGIHIGLAVDTAEGLLVPVVRDVQAKSVRQVAAAAKTLVAQAQSHQISREDLQGGNFTITNLGMYNIDAFTPIINLPQCAILGVGRIVEKPAVRNGQVVPRHQVALSLTFDHRVVDGGPAARFLDLVRELVETPLLWLAD
ncbi:MAG: 2-oxo acid dehydrogenase subunit E2 [Caldilineaceae bacterium]